MKRILKMILLVPTMLCCLNTLVAQEEKETIYALKLYFNYNQSVMESTTGSSTQPGYLNGNFTPSFTILKPRTFHEIELANLNIRKNKAVYERDDSIGLYSSFDKLNSHSFAFKLKYEYGVNLVATNEFKFSLSAAAEPYFTYLNNKIEGSRELLSERNTVGGQLYLIPRGTYDIGERWFVDINFPIEIMHIYREESRERSPLFGRDYIRTNSSMDFFNNVFRFRVGIGLKL